MSENNKFMQNWQNLSPGIKRIIVMAAVIGILIILAFVSDTFLKPGETKKKGGGETVHNVLTNSDSRKLGIDGLSAQVQRMRREIADLTETVSQNIKDQDKMRRTRNGEVDQQISDLKKELREMKVKSENLRTRVESGIPARKAPDTGTTTRTRKDGTQSSTRGKTGGEGSGAASQSSSQRQGAGQSKDGSSTKGTQSRVRDKDKKGSGYGGTYFGATIDDGGISDTSELFSSLGRIPAVTESSEPIQSREVVTEDDTTIIQAEEPVKISVINAAPTIEEQKVKAEKIRKEREPKTKDIEFYMPTGSILSAMLLNGIDASTSTGAKQEPMPALLRIDKDAILPNRYSSDIKDCFVLVSGHGDLSSERAYLRGEYLSCVRNDGGILETKFPSYVVGEDGKAGMKGRLVSKQGQLIARTLVAGFASGVSKAFDVTPVSVLDTTSIGGSVQYQNNFNSGLVRGAAAQGASQALEKVADFYLKMAEQIFPVVEITAGRQVNIIVTNGTTLKLKNINELDNDGSMNPTTTNTAVSPAATQARNFMGGRN